MEAVGVILSIFSIISIVLALIIINTNIDMKQAPKSILEITAAAGIGIIWGLTVVLSMAYLPIILT